MDGDGLPRKSATVVPPFPADANVQWFVYKDPSDEPLVDYVPFLAVFNDAEARERFDASTWRGLVIDRITPEAKASPRSSDQTLFIEEQSDIISFNRFTGVPGLVPK
jgi:hypothetical protein